MKKHADSHVDHGLTEEQLAYLLDLFADRAEFFVATVDLPEGLGTVSCALYGPAAGDPPVSSATLSCRPGRAWDSRLVPLPVRQTRAVTVVAGPHQDEPCVLYTAYGGPSAPQEPGDPGCRDKTASEAFWAVHALAKGD
jgi:hypothetical protein